MRNEYVKCGYALTNDGDVADLLGITNSKGQTDLYYNNEPYGIVNVFIDSKVEVKDITGNPVEAQGLASILVERKLGDLAGIVLLEDKILCIRDFEYFYGELRNIDTYMNDEPEKLDSYTDTMEFEDDSDDFEVVAELLGIA